MTKTTMEVYQPGVVFVSKTPARLTAVLSETTTVLRKPTNRPATTYTLDVVCYPDDGALPPNSQVVQIYLTPDELQATWAPTTLSVAAE